MDQNAPIIAHPMRLPFSASVDTVACGFDHTLCLVGPQVYGWGSNSQGQLGIAPKTARLVKAPTPLDLQGVTMIAAGVRTSFFVAGDLLACGFNKDRALGCGLSASQVYQPTPSQIGGKTIA